MTNPARPRPLFLEGTLRAMPLLAWALTGDSTQIEAVGRLVEPAKVKGYARFSMHNKDHPAVIKHHDDSVVDGLLLHPTNLSQRKRLDNFKGDAYRATAVAVQVLDGNGDEEVIDADMYVWIGELEDLSDQEWDLDAFIRDRLAAWLGLFGCLQLRST